MARLAMAMMVLAMVASAVTARTSTVVGLSDLIWKITNGNGTVKLESPVPAYPLELLRERGDIPDPLYG